MWNEAEDQLRRLRWSPQVRQQEDFWRALIYLGRGQYDEIVRLNTSNNAENNDIAVPLVIAYAKKGAYDKALTIARQAVAHRRPGAESAMGRIHAEMGDYNSALIWYERAAQRLDRAAALRGAGRTLMALGDYREARIVFEQAIQWSHYVRPEDLLKLAECWDQLCKGETADEARRLAQEHLECDEFKQQQPKQERLVGEQVLARVAQDKAVWREKRRCKSRAKRKQRQRSC